MAPASETREHRDGAPAPLFDDSTPPRLRGVECNLCGGRFFPPQQYGCEACGAGPDRLGRVWLRAVGAVHTFAVVHRHGGTGELVIGEVLLDDGPLVRCRLDWAIPIGVRVVGVMHGDGDEPELRFVTEGS